LIQRFLLLIPGALLLLVVFLLSLRMFCFFFSFDSFILFDLFDFCDLLDCFDFERVVTDSIIGDVEYLKAFVEFDCFSNSAPAGACDFVPMEKEDS
jgi:hypothetical protein